ncbi:MAG: hypothetical protein JSR58_00435 [Verrucomicrobia bacterium]|nr:hypothetical protein [Verrucomicrobiota bacterium]
MESINLIKGISLHSGVDKAGMSWSIPWALEESRSFMREFFNSRNITVAGICLLGTVIAVKLIWDYFKKESASTTQIARYEFFFPMSQLSIAPITDVVVAKAVDKKDSTYIGTFPRGIWRKICEFLPNPQDILSLSQTCKALVGLRTDTQVLNIMWQKHTNDLEKIVFGKEAWNSHFGDVGEVDPIPEALVKALEEPCPFIAGKKVKETHIACWIPTNVNGTSLTLNTLGKLVKKQLRGHASKYSYIWPQAQTDHGDKPLQKGHWILLTKTVLEGSRNKTYDQQKQLVESYPGYEVPTALSTAIALFMHRAKTGERLYNDSPWTYTRCRERSNRRPLVVGGFEAGGLCIHNYYYDHDKIGVGGQRKFPALGT